MLYIKSKFKVLLAGVVLLLSTATLKAEQASKRPNIVFIYVDDWGWTDASFKGSKYYETPHIDRLASTGLYFPQAYSVGPNCAPSRASLMTGLYTPRHGIYTVGTAERGDSTLRKLVPVENTTVLDSKFTTIAEELKQVGYKTSLVGKWQLGDQKDQADAVSQGFEHVVAGAPGTPTYFYPYVNAKNKQVHVGLEKGQAEEYLTDRLTDEALAFLAKEKANPFFLYLSYFAVHTPIQGKPVLVEKYKNKKGDEHHNNPEYAAMIESVDQGVGRIIDYLESQQLLENTLIVFYSDNGGMGAVTSNAPLKGSKGMLYEGGVRVPLIFNWKGKIKPSQTDTKAIGIDFYPTFLEVAQIDKPLNRVTDGISLLPVLEGKSLPGRNIYWHFPAYLEGFKGDKRHRDPFRTRPVSVIQSGDYKLLEFYEEGKVELYNLKTDIGETTNLAQENPVKVKQLLAELKAWQTKMKAPIPTQLNPYYKATSTSR